MVLYRECVMMSGGSRKLLRGDCFGRVLSCRGLHGNVRV